MEAASLAAHQPTVTLQCLQGAQATARAEADSTNNVLDLTSEPGPSQLAAVSRQQALCTVEINSVQSCQLLCSMALELQAHCFRTTPLAIHLWTHPGTLTLILDLIIHAGFSLQASALNALAAIVPELEFDLIPVQSTCTALLTALEDRMSSNKVPLDHQAFDLWQMHMLTCLNLMVGMLDGSQAEVGVADNLLPVLIRVAASLDVGNHAKLQIQLCKVILHVVRLFPDLGYHATGLLMLLCEHGQLGSTLTMIFEVVLHHVGAHHLDKSFGVPQVCRYTITTWGTNMQSTIIHCFCLVGVCNLQTKPLATSL